MSLATTTYLVETKYVVDDRRVAGGLKNIGNAADKAAFSTGGLRRALLGVGAAVAGGSVLLAAKNAFIGFNSQVEQSKISLATTAHLLQGGQWSGAMRQATGLFSHYQQVAKKSVGETKDFVEMHRDVQAMALKSGLSMKQLTALVEGATVASQVFGERADIVALDVKQMLAGTVTARDRVAQILLASQKVSQEAFNAMSQQDRNKVVMGAFSNDTFRQAAKSMEKSFAGVWSTFKDNLSITLGKVGLPLMEKLTAEVRQWNEWIDKHPQKIQEFAEQFGKALADGFRVVKSIATFIADNREVLLAMAKAALVFKGVGMIGGSLMAFGGAAGGLGKWFGKEGLMAHMPPLSKGLQASAAGLATFSQKVGGTIPFLTGIAAASLAAGTALHALAQSVANYIDEQQEKSIQKQVDLSSLQNQLGFIREGRVRGATAYAREAGFLNKGGGVNDSALWQMFEGTGLDAGQRFSEAKKLLNIAELTDGHMKAAAIAMKAVADQHTREITANSYTQGVIMGDILERFWKGMDRSSKRFLLGYVDMGSKILETFQTVGILPHKKEKVHVEIHKVEVPAKDPDRWIHDLNEFAMRRVRAPTQARAALTGGF